MIRGVASTCGESSGDHGRAQSASCGAGRLRGDSAHDPGLRQDGFGDAPLFRCLVVENEDEEKRAAGPRLVGYALSFFTYSTWEGRALYLEDLYVMPEYRGRGIGSRLFAAVAELCLTLGCARLQLSVLDWNKSAISFYRSRGARDLSQDEGWHLFRFLPEDLRQMKLNNPS
ncbi:thialysine N-epsilon-acetyltransferase isoform X2 [Ranitomeya variabilis]|uniref:thialysine N-epsilon-acetyltransferase isoform X2 n=1 Tax=Ranitomeya variabilis TaxID=490064 RepID=UPI004056BA2C